MIKKASAYLCVLSSTTSVVAPRIHLIQTTMARQLSKRTTWALLSGTVIASNYAIYMKNGAANPFANMHMLYSSSLNNGSGGS